MLKVGLTGSIAVGKSFVCGILHENGCVTLDADKVAREVVEPGTKGLELLVQNFGGGILDPEGRLDRKRLGGIVFSDNRKRKLLNALLHPLVIDRQDKWIKESEREKPKGIAVVDAALMIESGSYKRFEKLIVVWCDPEIQLKRLMLRSELGASEALERINTQMPQDEKKSFGDFLIDTSGGVDPTTRRTLAVLKELKALV